MTKIEYIAKYGEDAYKKHLDTVKQSYIKNKEKELKYNKEWKFINPKSYRANNLVKNYRRKDNLHNRGECTLTADWIINNIFNCKCVFCGESDWHKLGCDRIDNDKPHTPDNVQCCCYECNVKKHTYTNEEYINKITN